MSSHTSRKREAQYLLNDPINDNRVKFAICTIVEIAQLGKNSLSITHAFCISVVLSLRVVQSNHLQPKKRSSLNNQMVQVSVSSIVLLCEK